MVDIKLIFPHFIINIAPGSTHTTKNTILNIFTVFVCKEKKKEQDMSCCGGNCGCGSGCKCGTGCSGCKMYPDMSYAEDSSRETLVFGVAPKKENVFEIGEAAENGGCKCGSNCTCDPCTCNK